MAFTFLGIDPGKQGAIASLVVQKSGDRRAGWVIMPNSPKNIWEEVNLYAGGDVYASLEWVNPGFVGSSKSSVAKLYGNFTELRMALTAAKIPFQEVKPHDWQKSLRIKPKTKTENYRQWKERLVAEAQKLFPGLAIWTTPKSKGKQLAIADALLIAEHCRRTFSWR